MPSKSYYEAEYAEDKANQNNQTLDEYLLWAVRFYDGTVLYRRGWRQLTAETLEQLDDPEEIAEAREYLDLLGARISREWPKSKVHRQINTRHMSIWGLALLESMRRDEPLQLMDRVCDDVDELISGKLTPDDIGENRYYPEDPNDAFSSR